MVESQNALKIQTHIYGKVLSKFNLTYAHDFRTKENLPKDFIDCQQLDGLGVKEYLWQMYTITKQTVKPT